jgi:hypothetical protein
LAATLVLFISSYAQNKNNELASNRYPNELQDYQFYRNEKVKQLIPAVSTTEDVLRNFGKNCYATCDYDEKWEIGFLHFGAGWQESVYEEGRFIKWTEHIYPPEIIRKISIILFLPKKSYDFSEIASQCNFGIIEGGSTKKQSKFQKEFRCERGGQDHPNISTISFADKYGLKYVVCDHGFGDSACKKGELLKIEYGISDEEKRKIEERSTVNN